jgi:16S rRNA pseudouridine516 synthase
MSTSRLDRHLAHALGISRTDAQKLVRRSRVTVDGHTVKDPSMHVGDGVCLDGDPVILHGRVVLMLHKPTGLVSATRDNAERTVIDIVPPALRPRDLSPVGRLDKDTTGLLILTNDGQLNHRLTHPKRHVARVYEIIWEGTLAPDAVARVAAGLPLEDGTICLPAELRILSPQTGEMTTHQGLYHQVRRMIAALGGHVTRLHRPRYGPLELGDLPLGATRPLTEAELALIDPNP